MENSTMNTTKLATKRSNIIIFTAKKIITMNPRQPVAQAVAVRDGRILGVGTVEELALWGEYTLDNRFAENTLMPGMVEGHCHLKEGAMWQWVYLGWFDRKDPDGKVWPGLRSMQAVVDRLSEADAKMRAAGKADTDPLCCWGFDPIYFGGERMSVEHLSPLARPVLITHANGHLMNVNQTVLTTCGITSATDVEGVVKFGAGTKNVGKPTGELQEPAAMYLVLRKIEGANLLSPMTEEGMHNFGRIACAHGVTTATDLVNALEDGDIDVLERSTLRDDFPVRIFPAFRAYLGVNGAHNGAKHVVDLKKRSTEKLGYGLVKMMLDGSIQGFSARMRWPGHFNGAPNGIWVTDPEQYEADFETYHKAGLTIHTHTNGDQASEVAINVIERILTRAPRPGHRHTLQHGQMIDAPLFARMAELGLAVNLFANHLWYWGDQHYEMTMGPDRANRLDACRSALDAGVPLGIHSDAPVTPLGPLFTVWCAVNRLTPKGRTLGKTQQISVMEALHAVTLGPAWTLKMDHLIGSIECGKYADFAVLNDDPLEIAPEKLKDVSIAGTVLGGIVYLAS
jgi:predicted amidohydrolase YtcJ